jgi:hypothetical protein
MPDPRDSWRRHLATISSSLGSLEQPSRAALQQAGRVTGLMVVGFVGFVAWMWMLDRPRDASADIPRAAHPLELHLQHEEPQLPDQAAELPDAGPEAAVEPS